MRSHAERYDALRALLARPDPMDLPARGHRRTQDGDPERSERIKIEFSRAYIRHRMMDAGWDESTAAAALPYIWLLRRRRMI